MSTVWPVLAVIAVFVAAAVAIERYERRRDAERCERRREHRRLMREMRGH